MKFRSFVILVAVCLASPLNAQTGWVERIVDAYRHQTPIETETALTQDAAERIQEQVISELQTDFGPVAGYKAGLTSKAAQERFNVSEPILGTLLENMILDDGSRVSIADGVHLLIEADLLVRVKDPSINEATDLKQAFGAIDLVVPFLEIPDIIIKPGQPLTGPVLTAVNSGARYGVTGKPTRVEELTMQDLSGFTVALLRNGEPVANSSGQALMGDPLNVVLWIARKARQRGITLKTGDWLSLGTLTPPTEVVAGQEYRAIYKGLGREATPVYVGFVP